MQLKRRSIWAWLALVIVMGGAGAGAGFFVGRHWQGARLQRLFARHTRAELLGWSEFAHADFTRYESGRAVVGHTLYILGGFYSGGDPKATARVDALDLVTHQWTRKHDMPVALTHAPPVVVRDTVYMVGGFEGDHPGPASAKMWRWVPASDQWSRGPDLPEARGGGALVANGDTLHYFGGWLPDRNTDSPQHWTLVLGADHWNEAASLPVPRGHLSGVALDGALYAVSGCIGHDPIPIDVRLMHRYDLGTHAWSASTTSPMAMSHTEGATMRYENGFITVGGRARDAGNENEDDVLRYDATLARWIHVGRLPERVLGAVGAIVGDTIIAGLGALNGNNPTNPIFWSTVLRNRWHPADSMPSALGEVSAAVMDGKLYVTGEGVLQTQVYDIAAGRWLGREAAAARPMPGDHQAADVVDGRLFLLGGMGKSGGVVQIYDPKSNTWSLGPPVPFATGSSATAVINGKIFVAGGIVGDTSTVQGAQLDVATMTWTSIAPMPKARNHAASGTDGRYLYVFGGRGPGSGNGNVVANGFNDVQRYDPQTNSWTISDGTPGALAPLPQERGGTGKAAYVDGEFWVIGGETLDGTGASAQHTYARVDIYDPTHNAWRRGPDLPTARHGIYPVVDAGQIFVAGGSQQAGLGESAALEILWPKSVRH